MMTAAHTHKLLLCLAAVAFYCIPCAASAAPLWRDTEGAFLTAAPHNSNSSNTPVNPALTAHGVLTGLSCIVLLLVLSFDVVSCALAMFGLSVFLRISGVITTSEALAGLMNTSVVTVQLLVVLTAPVAKLPLVRALLRRILNSSVPAGAGRRWALARMNFKICLMAFALSWFVGNIPVTVMLTTLIHQFCIENDLPSSQLLMSVQVAGLVGGTFSRIGVSTTMLVSGLMETRGLGPLPFFETIKVSGLPAIAALVYMTFAPHYLLPRTSKGVGEHLRQNASFLGEFVILATSPLVGRRVAELRADLVSRHADIVSMIDELKMLLVPPTDDKQLTSGCVLTLTGEPKVLESIAQWLHLEWQPAGGDGEVELSNSSTTSALRCSVLGDSLAARLSTRMSRSITTRESRALSCAVIDEFVDGHDSPSVLAEVVISNQAAIAGRPVGSLRSVYRLALLGLRRCGKNFSPSQVLSALNTFHGGDTLLLVGPLALFQRYESRGDFLVVTLLEENTESPSNAAGDAGYIGVPMRCPFGQLMLLDGFGRVQTTEAAPSVITPVAKEEEGRGEGRPLLHQGPPEKLLRRYRKVIAIPPWYPYLTLLTFTTAIGCSIGGLELVMCCQVAVVALISLGLRRLDDAFKSLKLEVFLVMAFSFGLGTAMTKSGLSSFIASRIAEADVSGWTLKFIISLAASGMSNIISSKAAAQVLLPVVVDICAARDEPPLASVVVLAVSIIQSLITPYAHGSGLVVQGPAGYTALDFYRVGTPLNIILCVLVATTAELFY